MTSLSFESVGRSLAFLCFFIALPTQAYMEQDLKAFAKLEQDMAEQPEAAKAWPTDDIQNKAHAYREETLTLSRKVMPGKSSSRIWRSVWVPETAWASSARTGRASLPF